jgi:hypothetical protein
VVPPVVVPVGSGEDFRRRPRTAAGVGSPRGEREGPARSAVVLLDGRPRRTDREESAMFEDQKVELLPERTTMQTVRYSFNQNANNAVAAAVNAGNINVLGNQANVAAAAAAAGSNFGV